MPVKCGNCKGKHSTAAAVAKCYAEDGAVANQKDVQTVHSRITGDGAYVLPNGCYRVAIGDEKDCAHAMVHVFSFESGRWRDKLFVTMLEEDRTVTAIPHPADRDYLVSEILNYGWSACMVDYSEHTEVCGACMRSVHEHDGYTDGVRACVQLLIDGMRKFQVKENA